MNDKAPQVAILEEFAAEQQALTEDQQAMIELQQEAANDPEAQQALAEAAHDVAELEPDQIAFQALKSEIDAKRQETLKLSLEMNNSPLLATADGSIAHKEDVPVGVQSGPYNNNRRA